MPVKITRDGDPCRHCGTPVVKRTHTKPPKPSKAYYFAWWFACPKCKALYMVEDAKRFFAQPVPLFPDVFSSEPSLRTEPKPAAPMSDSATVDDPLPPWGSCGPECPACRLE